MINYSFRLNMGFGYNHKVVYVRVSGLVTTTRLYMCVYRLIGFGYNHKVVYVRVSDEVTTTRLYMCLNRVWLQP